MNKQIDIINEAMFREVNQSLRNIEGCNDPKVVGQVTDLVNYISICRGAVEWIEAGFTLEQYIDRKLEEISSSSNLCPESKAGIRKQLDMLTTDILNLIT